MLKVMPYVVCVCGGGEHISSWLATDVPVTSEVKVRDRTELISGL